MSIPQIIPSFVANNLYILDRNIRMATMLGIVKMVELDMSFNHLLECLNIKSLSNYIIIFYFFTIIFLIRSKN